MKIVIDGRMIGWTGIGRYIRHLLRELPDVGGKHEYAVVLLEGCQDASWLLSRGYTIASVSAMPYSLREQTSFVRVLYELRPDLVHFTHFASPILYRRPFVVTIHDLTLISYRTRRSNAVITRLSNEARRVAMLAVLGHAVRSSRQILTPSGWTAENIRQRFGRDLGAMSVTYEAAELIADHAVTVPEVTPTHPTVLYVGNNYPFKNVSVIPAAMLALATRYPNLQLVLVGESDAFRRGLLASLSPHIRGRVIDVGRVSDAQLAWLYQHAVALVLPSLSEGFGLPGLEAMAHGLPVIASNASALPEVLGDAAIYFDPMSPGALAGKLASLISSPTSQTEWSERGLAHARKFSWRRMAKQTVACYETALDGSSKPTGLPRWFESP